MGDHDHDHDHESIFLTQEEQKIFLLSQTKVNEEAEKTKQQAFKNDIMEAHRKYNLRRKKDNENPPKKAVETKKTSENLPNKVPRWNDTESLAKKTLEIIKGTTQTKVPSTIQIDAPHKILINQKYRA
jgi:hypothetical protein